MLDILTQTNDNDGLTITFCDRGENHIRNQQIGQLAPTGFTFPELQMIHNRLQENGITSHLVDLGQYLPPEYGPYPAGVLVIRNGIDIFVKPVDLLWNELKDLTYDKHALMYGQVRQKHARHNLCFGSIDQVANYEQGEGTVVSFDKLRYLSHVRQYLPVLLNEKASNLVAEANHYYDVNKCGIGYHGDAERKIVVGLRLGKDFPLCYYWHMGKSRISRRIDFDLHHGDMYIMDEKACGFDYKKRTIPTLRHAAGCNKYTK